MSHKLYNPPSLTSLMVQLTVYPCFSPICVLFSVANWQSYAHTSLVESASQGKEVTRDSWSKRSSNVCSGTRYHTRDRVSIGRRIRNAPSPWSPLLPLRFRTAPLPSCSPGAVFVWRQGKLWGHRRVPIDENDFLIIKGLLLSVTSDTDTATLTFLFLFFYLTSTAFTSQFSVYNSLACLGLFQPSLISAAILGSLRGMHLGLLLQFFSLSKNTSPVGSYFLWSQLS
jgi:hypothetical protein